MINRSGEKAYQGARGRRVESRLRSVASKALSCFMVFVLVAGLSPQWRTYALAETDSSSDSSPASVDAGEYGEDNADSGQEDDVDEDDSEGEESTSTDEVAEGSNSSELIEQDSDGSVAAPAAKAAKKGVALQSTHVAGSPVITIDMDQAPSASNNETRVDYYAIDKDGYLTITVHVDGATTGVRVITKEGDEEEREREIVLESEGEDKSSFGLKLKAGVDAQAPLSFTVIASYDGGADVTYSYGKTSETVYYDSEENKTGVNNAYSDKIEGNKFVIDAQKPAVSINWIAKEGVEGVTGAYDGQGAVLYKLEGSADPSTISAVAIIEVSDINLIGIPSLSHTSGAVTGGFGDPVIKDGVQTYSARVEFTGFEKAFVQVGASDRAGRSVNESSEVDLIVDNSAPTMSITWGYANPSGEYAVSKTVQDETYYAAARVATVTLCDNRALNLDNLMVSAPGATQDSETLRSVAEANLSSDKKTCSFAVTFEENRIDAEDPCRLTIAQVTDVAGNVVTGASDDESTPDINEATDVTNGKYTSSDFFMLIHPIVSVNAKAEDGEKATKYEYSGASYYEGPLTLEVRVMELPAIFDEAKPSISGEGRSNSKNGSKWDQDSSNELIHIAEVLYNTDDGSGSSLILTKGGNRTFVVTEETSQDQTYSDPQSQYIYDLAAFRVDMSAPTLSVSFDGDEIVAYTETQSDEQEIRYYSSKRTALIKVTERNFDPTKITLKVVGGRVESRDGAVYWDPRGNDEYVATVKFEETFLSEPCSINVYGTDIVGRSLVDADDGMTLYTEGKPFEVAPFKMLLNPVLSVAFTNPEERAEGYVADENDIIYLKGDSENNGRAEVSFSVIDPVWDARHDHSDAYSIMVTRDGEELSMTPDSWIPSDDNDVKHTGVVSLDPGKYEGLTFKSQDSKFVVLDESEGIYSDLVSDHVKSFLLKGSAPARRTNKFVVDDEKPIPTVRITPEPVKGVVDRDSASDTLQTRNYGQREVEINFEIRDDNGLNKDDLYAMVNDSKVDLTADSENGVITGTYTITADADRGSYKGYKVVLSGTDRAGNSFSMEEIDYQDDDQVAAHAKAQTLNALYKVEDDGNALVEYRSLINLGSATPEVSILFDGLTVVNRGNSGEMYYAGENVDKVTARIVVYDDDFDYMSSGTKIEVLDGEGDVIDVIDSDSAWSWEGGTTYAASVDIEYGEGLDNKDRYYSLRLSGTDLAGNPLRAHYDSTGEAEAYVYKDDDADVAVTKLCFVREAPKLSVEYSEPVRSEGMGRKDGTLYYDEQKGLSVSAKLTVAGGHLDPKLLTFKAIPVDGDDLESSLDKFDDADSGVEIEQDWTSVHLDNGVDGFQAKVIIKNTDSKAANQRVALVMIGTNLGDLGIVSADSERYYVGDITQSLNGYVATLCFDYQNPRLTVEWKDDPTRHNDKYYDGDRTAVVTVRDENINDRLVDVSVNGEAKQTPEVSTEDGKCVLTYTVPFTKDDEYQLTVSGKDLSGNVLEGGETGEPGEKADNEGVYASNKFVVDKTNPKVTIQVSQTFNKNNLHNGTAYFNEASELTATVRVMDTNFNPNEAQENECFTASASGKAKGAQSDWVPRDNQWERQFVFLQNDRNQPTSNLTVTVRDLAERSTTYSLGGASSNADVKTVDRNNTEITADSFALDITAPIVTYQDVTDRITDLDYSGNYQDKFLFYNGKTHLAFKVVDALGVYNFYADNTDGGQSYTFNNDDNAQGAQERTKVIELREAIEFTSAFQLHAIDMAGNERVWRINPREGTVQDVSGSEKVNTPLYSQQASLYPQGLVLDTTAPVLTLSGVAAGAYYNTAQTVRLDVAERNFRYTRDFDGNQEILNITKKEGNASLAATTSLAATANTLQPTLAGQTPEGLDGNYSTTIGFAEDGHYSLAASYVDPSGFRASVAQGEFTIDRTSPTISVSFDNNSSVNGMYYPAARTATVVVTEHNFNASDFNIETTGSVSSWQDNGDVHTATVSFATDGRYTMTITGHDRAGNALPTYTEPEFVIDMTNPSIDFSGIVDGQAYNGIVEPTILFSDEANFDTSGISYAVSGTKNGGVTFGASQQAGDNSATVQFSDLGAEGEESYDPSVDDIYTIQANLSDMAGNSDSKSITFSVNRFGSNYRILDVDDYERNDGYLTEPQDVRVEEINVSGCEPELQSVTVTAGTKVKTLSAEAASSDTGFTVDETASEAADSRGWSSYTYNVKAGNFDTDGRYHVAVTSDDRATNKNTSSNYFDRSIGENSAAEVSFILDTTDPEVIGLNLEDGKTYGEDARTVTFSVVENLGLKGVEATLDGQPVELTDDGYGNYSFVVDQLPFTSRTVTVKAEDLAKRIGEGGASDFHVTTDVLELHLPLVVGGGVTVTALAIGAGVYFGVIRRRGL